MAIIEFKNAVIKVLDGTPSTPQEVELEVGEGNFTFTEAVERNARRSKGALNTFTDGDEQPMAVSFDAEWEYYTSRAGGDATIIDAIKRAGEAAGWVSTDSDPCAPYCVDIQITYTPACATGDIETFLFPDFRYESIDGDLSGGTFAVSGVCNATEPTVTRAAQP